MMNWNRSPSFGNRSATTSQWIAPGQSQPSGQNFGQMFGNKLGQQFGSLGGGLGILGGIGSMIGGFAQNLQQAMQQRRQPQAQQPAPVAPAAPQQPQMPTIPGMNQQQGWGTMPSPTSDPNETMNAYRMWMSQLPQFNGMLSGNPFNRGQ